VNITAATHEAGHALVAYFLGFSDVECSAREDSDGYEVTHAGPEDPSALENYLLAVVAMAGCCAQEVSGLEVADEDALNDMNAAVQWLAYFEGYTEVPHANTGALKQSMARAHALATAILESNKGKLSALTALFLAQRGQASADRIFAVLQA
jgi:hypothetical protein